MKVRTLRSGLVLGATLALPVYADAPIRGADRQYDYFTDLDTVITDNFTRLTWERPRIGAYAPPMTLAEARTYCANAARRLPSAKELLTLVDEEPHDEYESGALVPKAIDRPAFRGTPADEFWTSSQRPDGSYVTVHFGTGATGQASAGDARRIRCVTAR